MSFIKSHDGFNDIYKPMKVTLDDSSSGLPMDKYYNYEYKDIFWGYPWKQISAYTGRWHRHIVKLMNNYNENIKEYKITKMTIGFDTKRRIMRDEE